MLGSVILGKYRIVRPLAEGGMCKLFLARPPLLSRSPRDGGRAAPGSPNYRPEEVVVKVLREDILGHTKAREHFRREIFIMSRFQHPHAVAYIDGGPNEKPSPVLVMEYVRGHDLADLLAHSPPFTAERAGRILAQLCEVLGAAHAQGVVHRDLKPANIMLEQPGSPQESVKLMDFGLAKMDSMLYLDAEGMFDWSLPAASGTPEYIAPEQVRSSDVDGRGDLYSLGVILFEMLTGERPFDSPDINDLLIAHLEQAPPTFRSLGVRNEKSLAVELVVRRCLGKTPEGRFPNAKALIEAYERALGMRLRPRDRSPFAEVSLSSLRKGGQAGGGGPPPRGSGNPEAPAGPASLGGRTMVRAADRHAIRQRVEAKIPESMALLKIKGFIQDIGGELIESVPGLIRFRLAPPPPRQEGWSMFGAKPATRSIPDTDAELQMEKLDSGQNQLAVTLIMRPRMGLITAEWRQRCSRIGQDLQAYLVGM